MHLFFYFGLFLSNKFYHNLKNRTFLYEIILKYQKRANVQNRIELLVWLS